MEFMHCCSWSPSARSDGNFHEGTRWAANETVDWYHAEKWPTCLKNNLEFKILSHVLLTDHIHISELANPTREASKMWTYLGKYNTFMFCSGDSLGIFSITRRTIWRFLCIHTESLNFSLPRDVFRGSRGGLGPFWSPGSGMSIFLSSPNFVYPSLLRLWWFEEVYFLTCWVQVVTLQAVFWRIFQMIAVWESETRRLCHLLRVRSPEIWIWLDESCGWRDVLWAWWFVVYSCCL